MIVQLDSTSLIDYTPDWMSADEADSLYEYLTTEIPWRTVDVVSKRNREYRLPRQQCWMSDSGVSPQLFQKEPAVPWSDRIIFIRGQLEREFNRKFDYVLMNLYRDGNDYIMLHRDDEAEQSHNNIVVSISVGSTRKFILRKNKSDIHHVFPLSHGSRIVMMGDTQIGWRHEVPRDTSISTPRVNLTFRTV